MSAEGNAETGYILKGKISGYVANVVDKTLSIEGASADAKATGDGLNSKVSLDGSSEMSGNLKMGGYQVKNVGEPVDDGDAVPKSFLTLDVFSKGVGNGDFNERKAGGVYWMQLASCSNGPATEGYGILLVLSAGNNILQAFFKYNDGQAYFREFVGSAWEEWMRIDPTDSLSLKGGTVNGSVGFGSETNTKNIYPFIRRVIGSVLKQFDLFITDAGQIRVRLTSDGEEKNHLAMSEDTTYFKIPLSVAGGGTGANNAADARSKLGAAPAGYGLGEYVSSKTALANANSATLSGYYKIDASTQNGVGASATLVVDGYGNTYVTQTAILVYAGHIQKRHCINGVWGKWEWVNPPMIVGVEYCTTELWAGAPVYTMLIEAGAIPNTSRSAIDFPNGIVPDRVLRVCGQISSGETLPAYWEDSKATVYASKNKIYIETNDDMWSAYAAQVQVWYTR